MPLALIISSHVAGSQVGASAQAAALAQFRIESMVTPTVLYGRHPGWGIPGGAPVPIEVFEGMLDGIEANGLFGQVDLVITGYSPPPPRCAWPRGSSTPCAKRLARARRPASP